MNINLRKEAAEAEAIELKNQQLKNEFRFK
jgi:hypothetical protein